MNKQLTTNNNSNHINQSRKSCVESRKLRSGQAMLISILMVTAAALAIGLAVAAIGSSELVQTVAYRQSTQAYGLAETCLEDQLMRITRANYTVKTPDFTNDLGSCTIVLSAGPPYTITSTGFVGRTRRVLQVVVNVNNPASVATDERLTITSWEEVY